MYIEDSYNFRFISNEYPQNKEGILICRKLYTYKAEKSKYIVEVEQFKNDLYFIKFFQKNHRHSELKYNILTEDGKPRKKIYTCFNICFDILEKSEYASFGFVGSPTIPEIENETETAKRVSNNKRFIFYTRIITTFIGENIFYHEYDVNKNAYVLINKKKNKDEIKLQLERHFNILSS